jgi:hypothetical protein
VGIRWYAPDGRQIGIEEAEALLGDDLARRVVHTTLVTDKGRVTVSTVFLALDHSFGDGPPVLWETMVFGGPADMDQQRYTSREAAEAGHVEAVTWARSACDADGAKILAEETFRPGAAESDADHHA